MTALASRARAAVRSGPGRVALAWAAATLLALAALSAGPGVGVDEAALLETAEAPVGTVPLVAGPPLARVVARATHAVARVAHVPHLVAFRLATALAGALIAALIALLGHDLAGPAGAALAPALYWFAPRALHLGAIATADTMVAALALAVVWAYRRAALRSGADPARGRARRLAAALLAGVLYGLAVTARLDAALLLPALALHTALVRLRRGPPVAAVAPRAPEGDAGDDADLPGAALAADLEARLHGVPLALAAMAVLGPLVVLALWPAAFVHPVEAIRAGLRPSAAAIPYLGAALAGRPPAGYPLVVTALVVPTALLAAWVGGLLHAVARLSRAARGRPGVDGADELLLLLAAVLPFVAAQLGVAPLAGGLRPWLPAIPVLAVLATRALLASAAIAWPARARPLVASLAVLVLYPALRATVHAWPAPDAAWGELAGGAPGAASLRLARQEPGAAAAAVLREVNERARPGARVLWIGVAPEAVALYARDGRLRPDLVAAETAAAADLAVAVLDGGSRDREYQAWAALRTARPTAGAYLDDVPLAFVYARPGAWR